MFHFIIGYNEILAKNPYEEVALYFKDSILDFYLFVHSKKIVLPKSNKIWYLNFSIVV